MRWRTVDGATTRLSVSALSRGHLLELATAAGVMECVGARLLEV